MKILHGVWNLIRGGSEGQCAQTVGRLAVSESSSRKNEDATYVCRVAVFRKEGYYLDAVEKACGSVYHYDVRRAVSVRTVRHIIKLSRYMRAEHIDLYHAWDMDAVLYGCPAAVLAGIPFITSRRDMGQIYPRYKCMLAERWDRKAAAVVVNAEAIKNQCIQRGVGEDKIYRIDNMVDPALFFSQRGNEGNPPSPRLWRARRLDNSTIRLVIVSRLDPEKDVGMALRGIQQLCEKNRGIELVIAGDGVERQALEHLAKSLGIQEHVKFLGDVTDVPHLLDEADIGVLTPSRNEGLSNSIIEYMCAGLPVVATDCGGNRELIEHDKGGFIVPVGDDQELALSLEALIRDSALREVMGQYNRRQAEQRFHPDRVIEQYVDMYDRVLLTTKTTEQENVLSRRHGDTGR